MFVIATKYSAKHNYVVPLVQQIREHHPTERIVVVDDDSHDKSYIEDAVRAGARVEVTTDHHWMIGSYWHAFKNLPPDDFYYFLHDSMIVKGNMDYLKSNPLTVFACFERQILKAFGMFGPRIDAETGYTWKRVGMGCAGPIFFCQRHVMECMRRKGADKILPTTKFETGGCEACFGFFFEEEGFDISPDKGHNLYGNILQLESPKGKSGPPPHNTEWQYPIEKFYASHRGKAGDGRNKNAGFNFTGH